jgi:hypothetical protein
MHTTTWVPALLQHLRNRTPNLSARVPLTLILYTPAPWSTPPTSPSKYSEPSVPPNPPRKPTNPTMQPTHHPGGTTYLTPTTTYLHDTPTSYTASPRRLNCPHLCSPAGRPTPSYIPSLSPCPVPAQPTHNPMGTHPSCCSPQPQATSCTQMPPSNAPHATSAKQSSRNPPKHPRIASAGAIVFSPSEPTHDTVVVILTDLTNQITSAMAMELFTLSFALHIISSLRLNTTKVVSDCKPALSLLSNYLKGLPVSHSAFHHALHLCPLTDPPDLVWVRSHPETRNPHYHMWTRDEQLNSLADLFARLPLDEAITLLPRMRTSLSKLPLSISAKC